MKIFAWWKCVFSVELFDHVPYSSQVIPLHLPPGDTSNERTVQIDGTSEQIEAAKQLVNEVISEVCVCIQCEQSWNWIQKILCVIHLLANCPF